MEMTRNVRMDGILMRFVTDEEGGGGLGNDDGKRQTCAAVTRAQPVSVVSHGYMGSGMVIPVLRPDFGGGLCFSHSLRNSNR
jgi:hypothetical protein